MGEASPLIRRRSMALVFLLVLAIIQPKAAEPSPPLHTNSTMPMGYDMYEELEQLEQLQMGSHPTARMLAGTTGSCGTSFIYHGKEHYRCGKLIQYTPCLPCPNNKPVDTLGIYKRHKQPPV